MTTFYDTCKHLVNNFNEFRPLESRASLRMNKNTCTIRSIKTNELKTVFEFVCIEILGERIVR